MPFNNFNSRHFSEEEKQTAMTSLKNLEDTLAQKLANLTPEERQQYGSINEQNKLIVNKVNDYLRTEPDKSSPDVDWDEFAKDFDSRSFIDQLTLRLESLKQGLINAKILHDKDNYQAALTDYDYAKYKNSTQSPGYETKVNELKQFFSGGAPANKMTETPKERPEG